MKNGKKILSFFTLALLMTWFGLFFLQRIDLTAVDLGRHIKNGELVLEGEYGIFDTNFYSYTEPGYPTVNHHWGSGVVFNLIWRVFGFSGLSLFCLLLSLTIFYLFFRIAQEESNFKVAFLVSLPLIPLMAARREIRPEVFSYFFLALFFWLLWRWRRGEIKDKWLWLLPVLEIIWVNTHVYFIFGPVLIGLFWLAGKGRSRPLSIVLVLTVIAGLISPFGLKGLLYPFNIFRNYGYRIVENQTVRFLQNWGMDNRDLFLFQLSFAVLAVGFILLLARNRRSFSFVYFSLALIFGLMGWMAIRNFTVYAFFALPIIAYQAKSVLGKRVEFRSAESKVLWGFLTLAVFLVSLIAHYRELPLQRGRFGLGLMPGNDLSAQFFRRLNLKGPIFNNYDIGGYLIYSLYPGEKVFTDNRPEAYSVGHFQEVYIPAQQDSSAWKKLDEQYHFNVIFFSYRDYTPWGQQFLIEKVGDDDWVPVFADSFAIIFVKNNEQNREIIENYRVPRENFSVTD